MKIVVTGSSGVIGRALTRRLLNDGHEVTGVDPRPSVVCDPGYTHLLCCIETIERLSADRIYHLAGMPSPSSYLKTPVAAAESTFTSARQSLVLARETGARCFIASTSEIYGDGEVCPQEETHAGVLDPCHARSCYGEMKRATETLACAYAREYGLEIRIARLFNTYGNGHRDDARIINASLRACMDGHPITIYGDGTQTRSYCYVDETVDAVIRLMESGISAPVNIGNPDQYYSVNEVVDICMRASGHAIRVIHMDNRDMVGTLQRQPDIFRARTELGWSPYIGLHEGISRMLEEGERAPI